MRSLLADGHSVDCLVRETVPWLQAPQRACDLSTIDTADLATMCAGADAIVHLAGEDEVLAARDPALALRSTVVATERVAEAARAAGVGRLVYLSTVHVYGARMAPGITLTEDLRPEPRSAYAIARLASEHVAASRAPGAYELVVLRVTNAVGAPVAPAVDRWSLVTNDLARQGAVTGRLRLNSAGRQWRDFVALPDVCSAITVACGAGAAGHPALAAGTYNIGSGSPTTVLAAAHAVQDALEELSGHRPELDLPLPPPPPVPPPRPAPRRRTPSPSSGRQRRGSGR